MKKFLTFSGIIIILLFLHSNVSSQQQIQFMDFDSTIALMRETFRQEEHPSNIFYPSNQAIISQPATAAGLSPESFSRQIDLSVGTFATHIPIEPNSLYVIRVYDFDLAGILDAGEWHDMDRDLVVDDDELFDSNANDKIDSGDWNDLDDDGIVDYPGEFTDRNGNGIMDAGEWHDFNMNGVVERNEWIDAEWIDKNNNGLIDGRESSIKESEVVKTAGIVYLKIYKRVKGSSYKEIDYSRFIFRKFPQHVRIYHPALVANDTLTDNEKSTIIMRLNECTYCDVIGDVVFYEDEYARIVINFQGFIREITVTQLAECEGCQTSDIDYSARFQVYVHRKFFLLFDEVNLHRQELKPLPDHDPNDGLTPQNGLYYSEVDELQKDVKQVIPFDPYYLVFKPFDDDGDGDEDEDPFGDPNDGDSDFDYEEPYDDDGDGLIDEDPNNLWLYETDYGKALVFDPYNVNITDKEHREASQFYMYHNLRITLSQIYSIRTQASERIDVVKLTIDENNLIDDGVDNDGDGIIDEPDEFDVDDRIYAIYYDPKEDVFTNEIIFPMAWFDENGNGAIDDGEERHADFGIVVERIDVERDKVWLKFIRLVDIEKIDDTDLTYADYQIIFDEWDREKLLGPCCQYEKKYEDNVPKYSEVLIDIITGTRNILNYATVKYDDLKGRTQLKDFEEQPHLVAEGESEAGIGTIITAMSIEKWGEATNIRCDAEWRDANGNGVVDYGAIGEFVPIDSNYDRNLNGIVDADEWTDWDGDGVVDYPAEWQDWNQNGILDAGEWQDLDFDGVVDYVFPREFTDRNGDGTLDAGYLFCISQENIDGYAFMDSTITYTITITNNGAASLTNVIVTDTIPSYTTYTSYPGSITGPGADDTGAPDLVWGPFTLLPGATVTLTYDVTIDPNAIFSSGDEIMEEIITNDARVNYEEPGLSGTQTLTSDPVSTNIGIVDMSKYVRNTSNLAVTPNAYPGDTLNYRIDYSLVSTTTDATFGVTGLINPPGPNIPVGNSNQFIVDVLPDGVTYVLGSAPGGIISSPFPLTVYYCDLCDGTDWTSTEPSNPQDVNAIAWQPTTIPATWAPELVFTVYSLTYSVTVDADTTGTITNGGTSPLTLINYQATPYTVTLSDGVTIITNPHDTEYSNQVWSTVISGIPAQDFDPTSACVAMDLSKSAPGSASLGEPILYTINYSNSGSGPYADAYNVVITDRIPDGTSISGVPPATHPNTGLPIMPVTYDTDGDGADDTILWDIGYLADGTSGTLRFSIVVEALEDIKINQYFIRVYEYPKFEQINDLPSKVMMGGIGSGKPLIDYSVVPTDVFKKTNDAEFIQIHRDGSKIETTVLRIFEKMIIMEEFIAEYVHFADDTKISDYLFWKKVLADISIDITYENLCCETEELTELYAGDEFLIYALIQNVGTGTAYDFTYKIDSPNLSPEDITWTYDKDIEPAENLMMAPPLQVLGSNNINPYLSRDYEDIPFEDGEITFLTFLATAPQVTHETTIPITVRVWYLNEYGEQHEAFKTIFLNVKAQRRGDLEILRRITGTEVMGQRFPENNNIFFPPEGTEYSPKRTDTVSMRVGDERTVSIFLRNPSDYELFNVHYIDVIPPGLEISSGSAEWWGTLKPSEVVRVTYKLRAKQVGTYQFKGKATYKDLRNQPYLVTSSLFQIVVKENDGIEILKDLDLDGGYNKTDKIYNIEKGGELVVVIKVKNNSDTAVGNLDVIELVPPGFEVKELFTEGLFEENGVLKYHISKLEASKYILIKYSLKASQQAGTYTLKATRLVYPHEGVKEEILSRHILPTEEGKPEERVTDIVIQVTETLIPNLSPSIDAEREVVASGENITLILKLQNTGGITAKNLKLTLPVPKGTKFLDASIQPVKENENLIFTIDEIPSGETYVLKPTFLSPNFSQDKTLLFTFSGMYTDDYKREYEIESELSLTIRAVKPRIDMVKRLSRNEVKIGYTVTFEISATNNGDTPAIVTLEDPIPQGFEIISGTNTWSGELLQGESVEIVYQVMCKKVGEFGLDPAKASYEDKWKTSYTSYSVKEFEDQYKLTVKGVLVSKTIDSEEVEVEDIIVVRVHIKNIYDEKAKKISVKDSIPDGLILVEGETSWYIEELGPSESVNFTYTLKTERGGTFTLPAILASFEDVYGDEYQSESDEVTLLVKEPVKPPEEVEEKPLEEEIVEEITPIYRFIRGYLLIFLLMVLAIVTFAVVILYLERRRREEEFEEYGVEELPYVRKPPEEEKSMRDRVRELLGGEEEEGLPKRPVAEERIPPEEIKGIPKEEVSLLEKLGVKKEREKPEEIFFEELPEAAEKPEEELSALERSMEEKKPPSLKEMLEKEREIKKDYIPTPQELIKERKKKERKEEEKDNISELELLDERKVLRRKPEDEMDKKDLPDIRDILKGKKEEEEEP